MRRTHLRGRENILKRYLVHVAAFNLSLVMRQMLGAGTPRGLAGRLAALVRVWIELLVLVARELCSITQRLGRFLGGLADLVPLGLPSPAITSSTGC